MIAPSARHDRLYEPLDTFVVRAPLLPVPTRPMPTSGVTTCPVSRLAVSVAAPDLAAALDRAQRIPGSRTPQDGARLARALLRYRIRMATRPTPYGLFAGAALGSWAGTTTLSLADGPRPVSARPDMGWLVGLVRALEQRPQVRRQLALVSSSCAVVMDGRVHLDDVPASGAPDRDDVSVRATPAVLTALDRARRPVAYTDLLGVLLTRPGATPERVHLLLDALWQNGLLRTDLLPPMTADPVQHVVDRLAKIPEAAAEAADLAGVLDAIARLQQAASLATAVDPPDGAARAAEAALTRARARARDLHPTDEEVVQVDSALRLAGVTLSSQVAAEAARAVDLLLRLHPAPGGPEHLAGFRAAFVAQYGTERRVPVPELLDPRFGLGPLPSHAHDGGSAGASAARRHDALIRLAAGALRDGAIEVELDDAAIDALSLWRPEAAAVPASVELSAFVAAESRQAIDRGDFRLVVGPNLGAPAAGRGLGRFAGLLGRRAADLLAAVAAGEQAQRPEAIHAELVYLPDPPRLGNVTVRPAVRGHEVVVGVAPGVDADEVVPVDELAVGVAGGRLRLWWPARGTEVVVCAGHMLNTSTAPAVCRFLSAVGSDGVTSLTDFDWGPAAALPFLPRVRHGRVVLRAAEWRQPRQGLARDLEASDGGRYPAALRSWRARWRVPRHVYLAAGDNRLLLDLEDAAQAELLREEVLRDRGWYLALEEALPGPGDAWLPGSAGRYVAEIVVPLVRRAVAEPASATEPRDVADRPAPRSPSLVPLHDPRRRRPPGSDWLFLTLYGPRAGEDDVVAGPVRALAHRLREAGLVDCWHFLRYADPEPHVRLRLHGDPDTLTSQVLGPLSAWAAELVGRGMRTRFGVDVYERELERYGGEDGTAVAETIFAADSTATADLIALLGKGGADVLEVAVLSADRLLASLGLDASQRLAWYGGQGPHRQESGADYRVRKHRLRRLLAGDPDVLGGDGPAIDAVLNARDTAVAPPAARLRLLRQDGVLTVEPLRLAASYLHLHSNRLLGIDPVRERLVLGLAQRTLASLVAAPPPAKPPSAGRTG